MNKFKLQTIFTIVATIVLFISCSPDKVSKPISGIFSKKILLLGEGGFNKNNASIDAFNPITLDLETDILRKINNWNEGDVIQSMARVGDRYVIAVNNSDKILWVTVDSFKIINTSNVVKPRYVYPISDNRVLVTSMNGGFEILKYDGTREKKVENPYWNERVIIAPNGNYYIEFNKTLTSMVQKSGFLVYNRNFQLIDSIATSFTPTCSYLIGNKIVSRYNDPSFVSKSKVASYDIVLKEYKDIELDVDGYGDLADGINGNYYFYKENAVWQIGATFSPTKLFAVSVMQSPYSLKSLSNGMIAISDAKDYNSRSDVYLYQNNTLFQKLSAPIITNFMYYAE